VNSEQRIFSDAVGTAGSSKFRVAVIGGGPGGLFTAWHLAFKAGDTCQITIFEASERPGGKILTGQFPGVGPYEAGVAEIYDYSRLGPDPLRDMIINDLGLSVKYIQGGPCVLDGKILLTPDDLAEAFGPQTCKEARAFRQKCAGLLDPQSFYLSVGRADNSHPWMGISGESLLNSEIHDDVARRYIRAMAHSDVAAAPHQTNGLNFLKNVLMDIDGYMDIFSVVGGNEQIVTRLVDELDAEIRLNSGVTAVQPLPDGTYRLELQLGGATETTTADFVVVALPLTALSTIHWRSELLQQAIDKHTRHFDRPGHYLRATLLFRRPFWRTHLPTDWWMLDAFDGCCVYDESARHDYGSCGALAFLISGNAALALANVSDERIEQMCLEALPSALAEGRDLILDRRIHRWMASVNAIPGGVPVRSRADNHRPDAKRLPGLVLVGDYIFDATLNGVLDSADAATDIIVAEVLRRRRDQSRLSCGVGRVSDSPDIASTEAVIEHLLPAQAIADVLDVTWGLGKGAKILHIGAGAGGMVAALRELGYDAIGIERDRSAVQATPRDRKERSQLAEFADLPFEDETFDVVIETGFCRLPPELAEKAIEEAHRVTRRGLVLGSVTTDLPIDLIERHDLLEAVETLGSRWDWSEKLFAAGFVHSLSDTLRLAKAWKRVEALENGLREWCEDAESLLYCVYERVSAVTHNATALGESPDNANKLRESFDDNAHVAPLGGRGERDKASQQWQVEEQHTSQSA
jgi:monoamine oxidase/SAM-dependent methyltransferase